MDSCYSFQNATGYNINDLLYTANLNNLDTSQINQGIIDSSNNNYIYSFNNSNLNFAYTSNSSNILYLNTSNSSNDIFISLTSNLSNLNSSGSNTSNYTFGYLDSNLLWTQAELFKLQVEHALQKAQLTAMSLTDSLMQASISTQSITLLDHGSQLNTLNDKIDDYIQYTDNASNVLSNLNSNTSNSLHSLNRNTSNDCIVYTNARSNLIYNNYSNSVFTSSNNNIIFTSNTSNTIFENASNADYIYKNNDVNFNCNVFIGPNASLIMNYNNPGSYYQNNGYSSFFNLSSTLLTYSGTDVQPFITNYNRLYRLNTNTALKLITYGNALTGQNSSTYILMDSGGENGTTSIPNIGTISFNISSTITGGNTDRFVITPSASVFNNNVGIGVQAPAYKLDVSGNFNTSGHININGMNISNIFTTSNVLSNTSNDCIAFAGNYDNIIYNKPFTRLGTLLYNDTACYIGIGKNNPTSLFEINTRHLDYFPIAWYKFNDAGNVGFDSIGTYHLTQNNVSTPVLSDSDSVEGAYSAKFNSLGRYLKISNNFGLNGGNFTICFWVKRLYVDRDDELFQIGLASKNAQKLIISYQSDNRISFNLIGKNVITPNTYLDQYTWVHLAFVYTNDFNVKIYRNSHLVHSDTTITTATNFSASSTMGFTLQDGLIDDFRIFNVALSAYDIFSIFYYFNDNNGLSLNSSYLNKTYKLNILPYDIANQRIGYKFRIVDNQTAPYNKDVIYIYDNGNVGIGIEPSYKLDISGDINFSGNLRKNGSTYVPDLALKANDANYAVFKIKSPSQNTAASLDLATPFNSSSVSKVSIVAQGISSFSRADLYFCLNNTADNTTPVSTIDSKMVIKSGGNVGINVINPAYKLDVNGDINFSSNLRKNGNIFNESQWITNGTSIYYNGGNIGINNSSPAYRLDVNGDINYTGELRKNGNIVSGNSQWITNGTSIYYSAGDVYINKRLCVSDGNAVAIPSNYMANGSLTIGSTIANFGGFESSWDYWTNNTAGMIMECLDRTSIAIHDAGSRVVGFMHYNGFNEIVLGYNLGWGYPSAITIGGGLLKIGYRWRILEGTPPTASSTTNSLIFHHVAVGINSRWWFNGTQTNTQSEISDERIKRDITDIEKPLEKLMLIKPKEYCLCDDKDYIKKFGIIAQDIQNEEELKHLIYTDEEYIANIYGKAEFFKEKIGEKLPEVKIRDESEKHEMEKITPIPEPKPIDIFRYTLKSEKNLKGLIDIDDELKLLLDNYDKDNVEIVIDDTPYSNRYKKRYAKVKAIIDDYTIEIYDDIEMTEIEKENLFIYGKKVDDFLKLDYKSLYCLNIKATQELYKIIQNQECIINNLQKEIIEIKSILNINKNN